MKMSTAPAIDFFERVFLLRVSSRPVQQLFLIVNKTVIRPFQRILPPACSSLGYMRFRYVAYGPDLLPLVRLHIYLDVLPYLFTGWYVPAQQHMAFQHFEQSISYILSEIISPLR